MSYTLPPVGRRVKSGREFKLRAIITGENCLDNKENKELISGNSTKIYHKRERPEERDLKNTETSYVRTYVLLFPNLGIG